MGKRGPSKTPTKILEMRGSPVAKDRHDPKDVSECPPCPECLTGDAETEWNRIVPVLDAMLGLGEADRNALIMLCHAWADYMRNRRLVEKHGEFVKNPKGGLRKAPYKRAMVEAHKRWLRISKRFGCDPASRADLGAMVGKENHDDTDIKAKYFGGGA